MHRYLRAIGFSKQTRGEVKQLVYDSIQKADYRGYTMTQDAVMIAEFCRDYADDMGICAAGTFDEEENFHLDFYFPYLRSNIITSTEDVAIERHASEDSYAGICDDARVGISLIFYLQNKIPYVNAQTNGRLPIRGTTLTLSALSVQGSVILPLQKAPGDEDLMHQKTVNRAKLLLEARDGNENAIELLTIHDMDVYTAISRSIRKNDVYTLVESTIIPYGVECDQYSVVGEITGIRTVTNHITEEQIYILTLVCNELTFDVAINIMDLVGEPKVGRRFKGVVWLQGKVNFPETE